MRKFEVGKVYGKHAVKFEIVARTAKTVTYRRVQHLGRENERKYEPEKKKIQDWDTREVFYYNGETVEA